MLVRGTFLLLLGTLALAANGANAAPGGFPSRPLTLVVGFAPGGGIDIQARLLAKGLERYFGQPVIVENRPGAGSRIASEHVARASPDGYTLLVTAAAAAIDMALSANAGVDKLHDFAPVSTISSSPLILVVNPSVPVADVQALVRRARSLPGMLNYSSSGAGTTGHLYGELFKLRTRTDVVHVPYKGSAPALASLLAGDVEMTFASSASVMQFVKAGRARALATTGARRSPLLPDVPTIEEAGVANAQADIWYGVLAPAATPPEVIEALAKATLSVTTSAEFSQRMLGLGVEPSANTPGAFRVLLQKEVARWAEVAKAAHIQAD
ncbi:MAG TPA: tripartite tricarboxylate transporter substrate binding protein [Casimicrobiaceae bacterium]|nr:tripartite tricarboxylate transporter substrate binding protein [Casimicrobiaceae bacterium]